MNVDAHPSLYRVAVTVLIVADAANILLHWVATPDDTFAGIISAASAIVVVGLLASALIPALARWREEALLLAFAVWIADAIEFATQDGPPADTKARQVGFYLAFAILALGTYLAQRLERQDSD